MCDHQNFKAFVDVGRITDNEDESKVVAYRAEIKINCADCGMAFEFLGIAPGYHPLIATGNELGTELRCPIKPFEKKGIVYIEHLAGSFEDGLQICLHCGKVICDYTGQWASTEKDYRPQGYNEGPIYTTGTNPVEWTTIKPPENYGGDDPYIRKVFPCTKRLN